ncbi:acetylxylan esterase [Arthrobacter sp. Soil762]|uniref:acetylxylan esterase n=1 Tax=Arthrobacter sp. Soil762 TaxID=1736401 RepID=UPI0006F7A06F|nr:acetylxylan esterase [Arthrobacter sp. Soil762]KRE72204.1 hypothetical protein ASG77_09985 [Arthrobacter sp. Soil762]
MPLFDLPLDQLRGYTSRVTPPADLQAFWDATIDEARTFPLNATFEAVENHLLVIDTFDVTFAGYGGAPIKGWLHLPANRSAGTRLPVVVQYIGYSGGRGLVNQDTKWAQAGYAHFIMDTKPGRRHCAEIAASLGRHRDRYEPMLAVLNYFDGVNLARAATAPALYSVAQMDDVCPPSTVFASFNAYGGGSAAPKEIEVYRFNNHEGGQEHHWIRQLQYLRELLG